MAKKIINGKVVDVQEEDGKYVTSHAVSTPSVEVIDDPALSVDVLMFRGFRSLKALMDTIESELNTKTATRDTVMNLRDAMNILKDFKKEERDILESLTTEELEEKLKDTK